MANFTTRTRNSTVYTRLSSYSVRYNICPFYPNYPNLIPRITTSCSVNEFCCNSSSIHSACCSTVSNTSNNHQTYWWIIFPIFFGITLVIIVIFLLFQHSWKLKSRRDSRKVNNTTDELPSAQDMDPVNIPTNYEPLVSDPYYDFSYSEKLNNQYLLYIEGIIKSNLGSTIRYDWDADGPAPALPAPCIPSKLS